MRSLFSPLLSLPPLLSSCPVCAPPSSRFAHPPPPSQPATFKIYEPVDEVSSSNSSTVYDYATSIIVNPTTSVPYVKSLRSMHLPIAGNDVKIEIDEGGNGKMLENWNIFSRPVIRLPYKTPTLFVSVQTTPSPTYTAGSIGFYHTMYSDREYRWMTFPPWMDAFATVRPSNEDTLWPGVFRRDDPSDLFCVSYADPTITSVYVIMDSTAIQIPDWIAHNYERLPYAFLKARTSSWDKGDHLFLVYWRRVTSDDKERTCFGVNGAAANNMYSVAFGLDPPSTVDQEEASHNILPVYTTPYTEVRSYDVQLSEGNVLVTFDDNEIATMRVSGTLNIWLNSLTTTMDVTVLVVGNEFRVAAENVIANSVHTLINTLAPLPSHHKPPFYSVTAESTSSCLFDVTFSTFPEDAGIRIAGDATFNFKDNQVRRENERQARASEL